MRERCSELQKRVFRHAISSSSITDAVKQDRDVTITKLEREKSVKSVALPVDVKSC